MKKPKPKKCKFCGKQFVPTVSTTQVTCYSLACTIGYTEAKKVAKRKKEHARAKREYYDNDRSFQTKKTQKAINAFAREWDQYNGRPCISCGRSTGCKINGGHFRSVGSAPHLRFSFKNIHLQCEHCNSPRFKSGNHLEYRKGLIERYGESFVESLEQDNEPRNFSVSEIKAIGDYYREMRKRLKEIQNGCYVQS